MNTNNKEALRLLESMRDFELDECNYLKLKKAMSLLEDNEDTEVQEAPRCGDINCNSTHCVKPSSKVEKLKELQRRFSTNLDYGAQWADLVKILNVLIEDEE